MTNILHEYPELMPDSPGEKEQVLKHYQGMALEAVETNMKNLTDVELVRHCQTNSTTHPLVAELSFRLNRYINLFKNVIQEQNK